MPFQIMNHKTGSPVEGTPKFKNYKDADQYLHKNWRIREDNQRHYYGVEMVKGTKKKTNRSKLKRA